MMTDDAQLLRRYTRERSEPAFGELVARHIDLVFAAALRVLGGDRPLAQDVTQTVFADLARKARSLPRDVVVAGWLYRHTCFTAAKAVRTDHLPHNPDQPHFVAARCHTCGCDEARVDFPVRWTGGQRYAPLVPFCGHLNGGIQAPVGPRSP